MIDEAMASVGPQRCVGGEGGGRGCIVALKMCNRKYLAQCVCACYVLGPW